MITRDLIVCLADHALASGQGEVAVVLRTLAGVLNSNNKGLCEFAKLSCELAVRELKRIEEILAAESN